METHPFQVRTAQTGLQETEVPAASGCATFPSTGILGGSVRFSVYVQRNQTQMADLISNTILNVAMLIRARKIACTNAISGFHNLRLKTHCITYRVTIYCAAYGLRVSKSAAITPPLELTRGYFWQPATRGDQHE